MECHVLCINLRVCISAVGSLKTAATSRKAAMSVIRGVTALAQSRELAVQDSSPHAGCQIGAARCKA